jgi:phospho-N-acetylmuramoyl-pentapeptide-transferase
MEILHLTVETDTLIRTFLLGFLGFLLSMLITPVYTTLAYRGQWWKKPRVIEDTDEDSKILSELHAEKHKRLIPTMAGGIGIVVVALVTLAFNLDRTETWLPLAAFVGAAGVGLLDDVIDLKGAGSGLVERLRLSGKMKLLLMSTVALIGGWFFYFKLNVDTIYIPFAGTDLLVGWLIIPLFVLVVVATAKAVDISDGLDGLAGGLAATAFGVYAIIAALQGSFGIAGFCMTIVGTLLSYTWFNIHPARFFMGNIGSFALGTALGVVAMLTDTLLLLPVIGAVFAIEAGSNLLQTVYGYLRSGKKIFKATPIHHHFEVKGWPETKVTMRLWVLGQVAGVVGLIIFLRGDYL